MEHRGAYTAPRAAALSGVPQSTVHYWSRKEVLVPSISPERIKLWSYADLMALRTIYWLRQAKKSPEGRDIPKSTMPAVRRALTQLAELDLELWTEDTGPRVRVDRSGNIHVATDGRAIGPAGEEPLDPDLLDLIAPFQTKEGPRGPDLQSPRPRLRIVPGKLAGSPHIEHTRVETIALAALADRDLPTQKICRLYPRLAHEAVDEALELERQLVANLRQAA